MRSAPVSHSKNPALILLVDDNRDGVLARRSVLEELGYRVTGAFCGSEALTAIERQVFDLIITDYRMEPMNGLELIVELRKRAFQAPIVLLTGFADCVGLDVANTGADYVIQKSANEIATLVRQTKRLLTLQRKPVDSQRAGKLRTLSRGAGQP